MEHRLKTPVSIEEVRALRAGDLVWISGIIYTARDKIHALLRSEGNLPVDLEGAVVYHCGPLIQGDEVISAGPTTSSRMTRYTQEIVNKGVRIIIGKGGISEASEALRDKAVYLAYPGGCGALAAKLLKLKRVHLPELGMAEALWVLDAKEFGPMIVAIDSRGRDLYQEARRSTEAKLRLIL
ncbi:MAG: FumA C-terminus/TtdB family hydratase beta subunit [Methanotrichaceae archaeon]